MLILVANLGSTSFKYKVLDMGRGEMEVARGIYERIGQPGGRFRDHAAVIDDILSQLKRPPDAIGFKAVHGGPISGAVRVTDDVIAMMERFADVAPAHNPPYADTMRAFARKLPDVPRVAAFETAFHQTIPMSRQVFGIPHQWTEEFGIRRYGFHGASHRWISWRVPELMSRPAGKLRIISCHLGGSSSICAISGGRSVANSFGMTAQSGLPHNNRVGDFDAFAIRKLMGAGLSLEDIFLTLSRQGGLLGISGVSPDLRDIEQAGAMGNVRARLAVDALVESARHFIGAYLAVLGGCDGIAFTGGIGENAIAVREAILSNMHYAGIELDKAKNATRGKETKISSVESNVDVWIVPANEELVVARQTVTVLNAN